VTDVAATLVSVPQVLPVQPDSDQVTPWFCASFCTLIVKFCVCDTWTGGFVGASVTTMGRAGGGGAAVTATDAEADAALSALDVADTVTPPDAGTAAGAE